MRSAFGWMVLGLALSARAVFGQSEESYPMTPIEPQLIRLVAVESEIPSIPQAGGEEAGGVREAGFGYENTVSTTNYGGGGGDCSSVIDSCGCECMGNWYDNTYIWAGGDTYKSIGERITNINGGIGALTSSFGTVGGFNTGFALLRDSKIRGQFGASYALYDFKGRLAIVPQSTELEEQSFVTVGVYKRGDMLHDYDPISWGLVYDNFHGNQWGVNANTVNLGQIRGIAGYALNQCTEIGVWGTFNTNSDPARVTVAGGGALTNIRAMNQANIYLKKNLEFGGQVTAYVGVLDPADIGSWQFGLLGQAPLSHYCSLYGNFTYVVPGAAPGPQGSGEEQFNVSVGLAYYFGGKAVSRSVTGPQGLPLLNVANNGSFLITD